MVGSSPNLAIGEPMKRLLIVVAAAFLFAACADPAANKSKAVTSNAAPVSSPAAAAGERYRITPANSQILFIGSQVTGSHHGSFERFDGEIDYAGAPPKSRVSITIETNSVK